MSDEGSAMRVRVEIDPLATDNESYNNCLARVRLSGGAVVVGWRLLKAAEHGGHITSREHHARADGARAAADQQRRGDRV
jgi:hypothetical protein